MNRVARKVNITLAKVVELKQLLRSKDPGYDFKKIDPVIDQLHSEIKVQGHALIEKSKIPPKPRKAADILAEIASSERLTPDLLDEIKRLKAKKKVPK